VLRITEISESAGFVTLKVEGRLVSEWITVLEQKCLKWLQAKPEVPLDFSGVTFIEHNSLAMLKRIASPNLRLINCTALINEMLNGNNGQDVYVAVQFYRIGLVEAALDCLAALAARPDGFCALA
jgi:hypothetical protein